MSFPEINLGIHSKLIFRPQRIQENHFVQAEPFPCTVDLCQAQMYAKYLDLKKKNKKTKIHFPEWLL